MTGRAAGRLQGDDLIGEVLRNMEEGLFRIRRQSLVPSIYRIYLSPDDYEPFRHVVPFVAGEIRAALDERLAQWNGSSATSRRLLEKLGVGEGAGDGVARANSCGSPMPGRSKFIPISTASCNLARLRFIQNWARRRRRNTARGR